MKNNINKSAAISASFKLEDFLYLNNIKVNLKKNKKSCICKVDGWFLKTKRDSLKPLICKGKSLIDAFIQMSILMSKQKIYSKDEKIKPIKVPKLT